MTNNDLTNETHPLVTADHLRRLAVVYIRQSTEKQVSDNTGSTDFQRSLAALARSYGWPDTLVETIEEDLGITGSSTERRRGWQQMQMMVNAKRVGAVFVATVSRLARDLFDFEVFRRIAAHNNTLIHMEGRFIDPADSNDILFSQLTAMLASHENRQRAKFMGQARITKAKQGVVVSNMPIGWIKGPNDKYDYDPETKDVIRLIIDTFCQTRSAHKTVMTLGKAGIDIPHRVGQRVCFTKPKIDRVIKLLRNPAYTGIYIFGKTQSQPGGPILGTGESKRIKVPEDRWIKTLNHHPAYMSQQQQEDIKAILKANHFERRDRPGRGPALSQGLLRCATCKRSMTVSYNHNRRHLYRCAWNFDRCINFSSPDFDQRIVAEVFKVLESPPLEMLKAALQETRSQEQTRLQWIECERERLQHEERIAHERAELARGSLPRVHFDALEKLEQVLEEKERFQQKIAIMQSAPRNDESGEELEELCQLASNVPTLWNHSAVTDHERKEILRCVIDHVVVATTKETIQATIFWKSGSQTPFFLWRTISRYNLIRELHEQKLIVLEIQEHLAAGKTSTGQTMNLSLVRIRLILKKLSLKPNRFSSGYLSLRQSLRQKAGELTREGRTLKWIARYFNEQGFTSPSGKPWTRNMVSKFRCAAGDKTESLEILHRSAIAEARARGLNYRQMAIEFNEKKIPKRDGQPWTARSLTMRWASLSQLQRKRAQKPPVKSISNEAQEQRGCAKDLMPDEQLCVSSDPNGIKR